MRKLAYLTTPFYALNLPWPTVQWPTSLQAVRRETATLALAIVARNAAYLQSILFTKLCALLK